MKTIAILATNFAGNKGAAAMLQSVVKNLGVQHNYELLSVYPTEDQRQNPYNNLKVVSCKPEQIIFIAFPLAILYALLKFIPLIGKMLLKHPVLHSFYKSDLVIDVAGITFVDSRGFVMNTYNFICVATPLLLGKKVVKFSQAMGPFSGWNKLLASIVLPKMSSICARGDVTKSHLDGLSLNNVVLCADGAFAMPDTEESKEKVRSLTANDSFYDNKVVSLSISSVVEKYCEKIGIDYKKIMAEFIDHLIEVKQYGVLIIANAAREGKTGRKNNDLIVCKEVYNQVKHKEQCRYYDEEFTPEVIRELIDLSDLMVASRFHAMIGALYKQVPVLLIGWSHKYKEVLDMFGLGKNATDYKTLNFKDLIEEFDRFEQDAPEIQRKIEANLPKVKESSLKNIEVIREYLLQ